MNEPGDEKNVSQYKINAILKPQPFFYQISTNEFVRICWEFVFFALRCVALQLSRVKCANAWIAIKFDRKMNTYNTHALPWLHEPRLLCSGWFNLISQVFEHVLHKF